MEHEGSLLCLQKTTTGSYSEPVEFSCNLTPFLGIITFILMLSFHPRIGSDLLIEQDKVFPITSQKLWSCYCPLAPLLSALRGIILCDAGCKNVINALYRYIVTTFNSKVFEYIFALDFKACKTREQ
jgi:hypothetical protein